jgi:predicted nucleotidyltransferase
MDSSLRETGPWADADYGGKITSFRQSMEMCVPGFKEALSSALQIQITEEPGKVIPVASPAEICLLKLISWLDRQPTKEPKTQSTSNI